MRNILMAAALATTAVAAGAIATAKPAMAQAGASLAGDWQGGYISSDGADVNTFTARVSQAGANISGAMYEVNAFGDRSSALFLTSTFQGTVTNRQVRFTKTYDGSGGARHSVVYVGALDAGNRRIRGTYDAQGATGTFEMVRN